MKIKTYNIQDEILMYPYSATQYNNVLIIVQQKPKSFFLWQWYQYPELFEAIDIEMEDLVFINQLNTEVDEYQRAKLEIADGRVYRMTWCPIRSSMVEKLKQPFCCPKCNIIIDGQPKECHICSEMNRLLEFEKGIEQPYYDEQFALYAPVLPPDGDDDK